MALNKEITFDNPNPWTFENSVEIGVARLEKNRGVN